jgi:hypothetical protein
MSSVFFEKSVRVAPLVLLKKETLSNPSPATKDAFAVPFCFYPTRNREGYGSEQIHVGYSSNHSISFSGLSCMLRLDSKGIVGSKKSGFRNILF